MSETALKLAVFSLDVVIHGACLWLALKIRLLSPSRLRLLLTIVVGTACGYLPQLGLVLSLVVFLYLLIVFCELPPPEAAWAVLVAHLLYFGLLVIVDRRWEIPWRAVFT